MHSQKRVAKSVDFNFTFHDVVLHCMVVKTVYVFVVFLYEMCYKQMKETGKQNEGGKHQCIWMSKTVNFSLSSVSITILVSFCLLDFTLLVGLPFLLFLALPSLQALLFSSLSVPLCVSASFLRITLKVR